MLHYVIVVSANAMHIFVYFTCNHIHCIDIVYRFVTLAGLEYGFLSAKADH